MTVGFFLVDADPIEAALGVVCATALIESVHRVMPGVPVVQFTDEETPAVPGVDTVARLPAAPMAVLRMRHHGQVKGEWLFVDSDVVVQRDVRGVFDAPFDIAVTTRNWAHLRPAAGFTERMPFNVGVVFSRSRQFWRDVTNRLLRASRSQQQWMGDQQAICDLIPTGRYRVAYLKGSRYNFPPALESDPETDLMQHKAAILHYKGPQRKALLVARVREGRPVCE